MDWQAAGTIVAAVGVLTAGGVGVWQARASKSSSGKRQHQRLNARHSSVTQAGRDVTITHNQFAPDLIPHLDRVAAALEAWVQAQPPRQSVERVEVTESIGAEDPETAKSVDDHLSDAETRRVLQEALVRLPPKAMQVVSLRIVGQLSWEQTAELMGVSVPVARQWLSRAMHQLRKVLDEDGTAL